MPKGIPTDETARQYKQRKRKELRDVWHAFERFLEGSGAGPVQFDKSADEVLYQIRCDLQTLRSKLSDKNWGR